MNISIQKWQINYFKINIVSFIVNFDEIMLLVLDKSKSKQRASVSDKFAYLTGVQLGISDLPFVRNMDYQYSVSHLGM